MNKILFQHGSLTLRVREVVIAVIVIIIILFGLSRCSSPNIGRLKLQAISDKCKFTNNNLSDLNDLLKRSDLCSTTWFNDLDNYITRLKEQNDLIKNKPGYKDIYKIQDKLVNKLEEFKEKQTNQIIDELEIIIKEYQVKIECKGEI